MFRDVAEQLDAGGFEGDVRIEAARDGAMDDRPPIFLQEVDQPFFRRYVAVDFPANVVQVGRYRRLFTKGWEN